MKYTIFAASQIVAFATFPVPSAFAEENGKFSLEAGMDYNTGNYGSTQSSSILYVPVTGRYQGKSWSMKLTVPYLEISGPYNVINGIGPTGITTVASSTRSGLGDVILAGTRNAYYGASSGLVVNLTGKIKFGTADSSKGLGTGKNDYAFQTDIYKMTGRFASFGTLGYKIYGKPAGYKLNNGYYGLLGGSYRFDKNINGGVMFALAQKSSPTGSPRMETIFFASRILDRNLKAQGYVLKGFTKSVPSWGVGASAIHLF